MEAAGDYNKRADELERLLRELQYMATYWEQEAKLQKHPSRVETYLRRRDRAVKLAADLKREAAASSEGANARTQI